MVGNPARQMGWMSHYGHRLDFDENGQAVCPESGRKYKLENDRVTRKNSIELPANISGLI
jgi:UDP-2-acetamido-3-amino-2,3-dideoxy-glucuronate N-acetyltransferase